MPRVRIDAVKRHRCALEPQDLDRHGGKLARTGRVHGRNHRLCLAATFHGQPRPDRDLAGFAVLARHLEAIERDLQWADLAGLALADVQRVAVLRQSAGIEFDRRDVDVVCQLDVHVGVGHHLVRLFVAKHPRAGDVGAAVLILDLDEHRLPGRRRRFVHALERQRVSHHLPALVERQRDLLGAVIRRGDDDAGEHEAEPDVGEVSPRRAEPALPHLVPGLEEVGEEREQRCEQEHHVQDAVGSGDQAHDPGCDGEDTCEQEALAEVLRGALPLQERHGAQQRGQDDPDREDDAVVEGRPNLRSLRRQAGDERRRGADEHGRRRAEQRGDRDDEEHGAREERLVTRFGGDLAPAP